MPNKLTDKVKYMNIDKKPVDRFDWPLAFILLLFFTISLIAIASAQTTGQYKINSIPINFIPSQIQWYVIGSIIIAVTMYLEPEQYKKAAWIIYGGGVMLLIAFFIILPDGMKLVAPRNGAKSWFHLPSASAASSQPNS